MPDRIFFCILFFPVLICAQTNGLINDEVYIPPNYETFSPPFEVLSSYIDPVFGTNITRITNSEKWNDFVLGGYFANSEICVFNYDGSYFIAQENDSLDIINHEYLIGTFLYDGQTGERIKFLGRGTIRNWWIRWAIADFYKSGDEYVYFDPKYHFYNFAENQIRLYDVRDMSSYVVLHQFEEYDQISNAGGEADISDDGRFWILSGGWEIDYPNNINKELFAYDLIEDIKYPVSPFDPGSVGCNNGPGVDYAAISALGNYIVVSWCTVPALDEQFHGIEIYDLNWNYIRQLYPGIVHFEVGVDQAGNEVIYTVAGFDFREIYQPYGIVPGDIISIKLSDGSMQLLKHIPVWSGVEFTACNSLSNGKYFYASYFPRYGPTQYWYPFWGEIIEVPTDGSGLVRRLLHHRSHQVAGQTEKYYQADAVINRQGTKLIYRSTYNTGIGDIYFIDIGQRGTLISEQHNIRSKGVYSFNNSDNGGDGHDVVINFTKLAGMGQVAVTQSNESPSLILDDPHVNYTWLLQGDTYFKNWQALVSFRYTEQDLFNVTESKLCIFRHTDQGWQNLGGLVNSDSNSITVPMDHFSTYVIIEAECISLNARIFLEGPYQGNGSMSTTLQTEGYLPVVSPYNDSRLAGPIPANITDWILLELRTDGDNIVYQRSFLLRSDGQVVDINGSTETLRLPGVDEGNYYVLLYHRNHLPLISKEKIPFSFSQTTLLDFTSDVVELFDANAAKPVMEGVWAAAAGDGNHDLNVTTLDYVMFVNGQHAGESGYVDADFDLNAILTNNDYILWKNNARRGAASTIP